MGITFVPDIVDGISKALDYALDGPLASSIKLLGPIGMGITVGLEIIKVGMLFEKHGFSGGIRELLNTPSKEDV